MDPADKMIQSIKEQHLHPTGKWYFQLRELGIWLLFALSVLIGAVAFSVVLFAIQQSDLDLMNHLTHSTLEMVLTLLPFIWIVFLLVALVIAIVSLQQTWRGYKISPLRLVIINLLMSILLGTALFIGGGAQRLEAAFNRTGFDYSSIQERKRLLWSHPDEGMLAGEVVVADDRIIQIKDFGGKVWQVNVDQSFIAPIVTLEPGELVKIVGKQEGEKEFRADEVRPWGGPGSGFKPGSGNGPPWKRG